MRSIKINLSKDIAIWLFLWLIIWGGFLLMRNKGVNCIDNSLGLSLYFAASSVIVIVLYRKHFHPFLSKFTWVPFIVLALVFAVTIGLFMTAHTYLERPNSLLEKYPTEDAVRLNYSCLVPLTFEIVFQQSLIILLVGYFVELGIPIKKSVLIFLVIFGLAHIPGFFTQGFLFGSFYFVASLLSAIIFPILIERVNYGLVYSFCVHFIFYPVLGFLIWLIYSL